MLLQQEYEVLNNSNELVKKISQSKFVVHLHIF